MMYFLMYLTGMTTGAVIMMIAVDYFVVRPLREDFDEAQKGWTTALGHWYQEIKKQAPIKSPIQYHV